MFFVSCLTRSRLLSTYDRILGVTTLDVVRTTTFVAEMKKLDMTKVKVPVIGGHSRNTILPLLSQTEPETSFTQSEIESMTDKVRFAGEEVLNAKAGTVSVNYLHDVVFHERDKLTDHLIQFIVMPVTVLSLYNQ